MIAFNYSCQGESHKADGKPCQDASRSCVIKEKGITICIVSDGHGGEQYFRSQVGSNELVDIAFNKIQDFIAGISELGILKDAPFTQMDITANKNGIDGGLVEIDARFMQLFRAIKAEWIIRIYKDAQTNELSEWELGHVKEAYLNQFKEQKSLEKIYGATLMAYVQTPEFWFAFHLGDGKMIMFDKLGKGFEPVLWDKDCFLNKTTSICQSDATDRFRYSFRGDGEFPLAVFLGSDGIDDTFTDGAPLYSFYKGIMQELSQNGDSYVEGHLKAHLPALSAQGSQDDMTVAYCYDESQLNQRIVEITRRQVDDLQNEFKEKYISTDTLRTEVKEKEEKNSDILKGLQESEERITALDIAINSLTVEKADLDGGKKALEEEMEQRIQAIRDEYKDRLDDYEKQINEKDTALAGANREKASYNTPENRAKKKIQIDINYAKSDIDKAEQSLISLVTRINRLKDFLGDESTTYEELVDILIPRNEDIAQEVTTPPNEEVMTENQQVTPEECIKPETSDDGAKEPATEE